MDARSDLLDLAQHLKQERLFVSSECQHVQNLNEKVHGTLERLFHVAWIAKQQRHNLESLILSRPGTSTALCCQKANALENLTFVDGYKQLSISESSYAECLQAFRENPKLIAMCLASGEKLNIELMHCMVQVVMGSIYGHCILQEDEAHVLHLLKHLMELQLATSDNPRRLLQHGSCAFSRVYKLFNEGLFLAKVFLTGALHEPIMHLLMEDELFLDIDPGKAVIRFPLAERLKRFGKEGTPQYAANLQKYRLWTISKLVNLTNRFISGIRSNLYCFPHSLLWLVKQLYNVVMKACKVEVREVGAMCADLVFAFFICPAIVNPEPYGICDAPISYIARFNLMQVAQILQVLAMSKWEEIDPKLMDLYGRFDRNVMSSVLDLMLEGSVDENPMEGGNPQLQGLVRTAILITHSDLMGLINFLRLVSAEASDEWLDKKALESLHSGFPIVTTPSIMTHTGIPEMLPISIQTPPHTPVSKRTSFTKVNRRSTKFPAMTPPVHEHYNDIQRCDLESQSISRPFVEDVLVISLNVATECPGMLPEHKILAMESQNKQARVRLNLDTAPGEDESIVSGGEMQEKRTRFSLSQDQDSIGNTSDNLEAVSEAASNHSVTSSLELENENENDNLSDMVSANVSGRGTPNVSGRDTPSSQVDPDERDQQQLDLPITARKQNREDINEKFGKFEIKGMIGGDETVSLVSDTWSTDVLASDSENVEQVDANQNEWPLDEISFASATSVEAAQHANLLDIAETCSEAWSTDVLASDSERLQELDTDDVSSIGRSDDTASVARSDDTGRSETDADTGIETLRVDVVDHGDENITPRASGSRSPIDGPVPDLACKNHWLHGLHVAADVHELSETFSLISSDQNQTDGDTPVAHRKHVLDPITGYDQLERQKSDFSPTSHHSEGFKGNQNMIATRHSVLDSYSENGYEASALNVSESEDNAQVPSDVTPEIMGMQTLGRLSLSIGEFTDNGFLTPDLPSLLNTMHCSGEVPLQGQGESSKDYLHRLSVPPDVDNMTSLLSQTLDVGGVIGSSAETTANVQKNSYVGLPCNLMVTLEGEKAAPACEDDNVFIQDSYQKLSLNEPKSPCGIYLNKTENGITHDSHTPATDQAVAKVEDCEDKEILLPLPSTKIHEIKSGDANICLSTVSLASNSSSGSGSVNGEVAALTTNGIHRLMDSGSNDVLEVVNVLPVSGAIPKSISFDKTAEKGDKEGIFSDDPKNKRGFFRNFKLPFRGKGRKSARYQDDVTSSLRSNDKESSEEILAKYRKKSSGPHMSEGSSTNKVTENADEKEVSFTVDEEHQLFDPQNPEASYAFQDAKKKLRLVLSTAELQIFPHTVTCRLELAMQSCKKDGELVTFLKIQLAEAINLQDRILAAQLHETLRCVRFFDKSGCRKLFKSLKDDYKKRCPYITYLVRCRQGLLSTLSHLERILKRIERDKAVCDKFMISVCVRLFLEKRERIIQRFMDEFQKLSASDEKTYLVEQLLQFLWKDMETDAAWQGASIDQLELAQQVVERSIMSQIYIHALYPNGDGDVLRDQLLHDHMEKLSKVITPSHKDLRISKVYCYECPWPSAQAEIMTINAFKTPRDKLNCVVRCCNTIMNLLSIASEKSVPAADDFIPVLVYVLIKANPNSLLSTVQYVNSFYQKQLKGEDEYWWIQFCSAIEFIKTMDYNE